MIELAALVAFFVIALTLGDWRRGLLAILVVAVLQDVFRKLTPGVPAYYLLWTTMTFGTVFATAFVGGAVRSLRPLYLYDPRLKVAWGLFFLVVLAQAGHALVRWGNPQVPVLGLLFYFGPVAALLLGVAFASTERRITAFLTAYVLIMTPAALTVYLSLEFSDQWPILRDIGSFVGSQLVIYDVGTALDSHPGLFRVGEIAAWHAATAAAILIMLATRRPSLTYRIIAGLLVVALVGAILLTGRRKMLMALTIFVAVQWALLAFLHKGVNRQTLTLLVLGVVGSFALTLLDPQERNSESDLYFERGVTVFGDVSGRFQTSLDLLRSAVSRSAGIGLGAGVSAQGTQYAGGVSGAVGGAAEAGLGKIVIELGIPGALVILWLLYRIARRLWEGFRLLAQASESLSYYAASFAALLIANIATFTVATQVYGDHAILILLGLVAGMLFSLAMAGIELRAER
ncbi:MAG: hypothetical protein IPN92_17680 [Chromatiaceae bacterium]|nr:hypothetical protein [Chromatiaceae bacterium]